jgi:HK97 family phage portal protein
LADQSRAVAGFMESDRNLDPLDSAWTFAGNTYVGIPGSTSFNSERIEVDFPSIVQNAYKGNGIVYACIRTRAAIFAEGRFLYQESNDGRPGDFYDDKSLDLLRYPWPGGTTQDLLTRTLQDADLAGNSYWTVRNGNLRRMRPDWITIIMGSKQDSKITPDDLDAELLGYAYYPGGFSAQKDPIIMLPDEVVHYAPMPDPVAHYRGMSWITPVMRELEADNATSTHKLSFFRNGASLQTIVSFKDMKEEAFERFMKKWQAAHQGAFNAYRTVFLGGGADVNVVGANLRDLDFKSVQGAGETRIAAAAGVHPVIVGLSEGLQGASLNAGNFAQARRQFAEGTLSSLWRNVASSFEPLFPPPREGSCLTIDTRDIPFLRQDQTDAAAIQSSQMASINSAIMAGFEPETVVAAIVAQDLTLLKHTGLFSVQLQPPGAGLIDANGKPVAGALPSAGGGGAPVPNAPKPPPTAIKPTTATK